MTGSRSSTAIRGNIFDALGLEDAPELQARVDLAVALTRESRRVIQAEGISQRALAERIGIDPADLSRLMNGTVGDFSQERLGRLLNQLGCEVQVTVRRANGDQPPMTEVNSGSPRMNTRYLVVIEKTDTGYSAYSPDLPGCAATGRDREEVERNMREAIGFHIDGLRERGEAVPEPRTYSSYVQISA